MKRNVKTVTFEVSNESILRRINNTPTFRNLLKSDAVLGTNFANVNHYTFSSMQRLFPLLGIEVIEQK